MKIKEEDLQLTEAPQYIPRQFLVRYGNAPVAVITIEDATVIAECPAVDGEIVYENTHPGQFSLSTKELSISLTAAKSCIAAFYNDFLGLSDEQIKRPVATKTKFFRRRIDAPRARRRDAKN